MTIPVNLTLIREDLRNPRLLKAIKADMLAAPTDYVMVVREDDLVDIQGELTGDVHYVATLVGTRRAIRYSRPVIEYDPVLLTQFNYIGAPILHKSLVPLFPETAVEPWHTVLVRAQSQGASFSLVEGDHTIIEPWPRPELSGAYGHYRTSFDPAAVMEAVPTVLVEEINHRPRYSLRNPRAGSVHAFCRNCSIEFIGSLAALNVAVEVVPEFDLGRLKAANADYVSWFDGIAEADSDKTLSQLQVALEFPGVSVVSPRVISEFTPANYHMPAFGLNSGIHTGFDPSAWFSRTRDLGLSAPVAGCTNSQAILRKVS